MRSTTAPSCTVPYTVVSKTFVFSVTVPGAANAVPEIRDAIKSVSTCFFINSSTMYLMYNCYTTE